MTWKLTVIDELLGSELYPPEYWVHREGETIRRYQAYSRADAETLVEMLNEWEKERV